MDGGSDLIAGTEAGLGNVSEVTIGFGKEGRDKGAETEGG